MAKKVTERVIAFMIILIIWQIGSMIVNKGFLPSPMKACDAFINNIANGMLVKHGWISLYRIMVSLLLAVVLALPVGYCMGRYQKADGILSPMLYLLYPLPKVVFLPIIVVIMGLGDGPKIFLITLVVFFQILVVVRDGVKSVPKEHIEAMEAMNTNTWQKILHLYWPYCLPKVLTALRITLGTAIAILFFAETFASFDGLGYFILNGMESRDYAQMYAGIIAMALLGLILYALVDFAEKVFCRWQKY